MAGRIGVSRVADHFFFHEGVHPRCFCESVRNRLKLRQLNFAQGKSVRIDVNLNGFKSRVFSKLSLQRKIMIPREIKSCVCNMRGLIRKSSFWNRRQGVRGLTTGAWARTLSKLSTLFYHGGQVQMRTHRMGFRGVSFQRKDFAGNRDKRNEILLLRGRGEGGGG